MCYLLVLKVALLVAGVTSVDRCPSRCFCSKTKTSVNCSGQKFKSIPKDIPPQVEKLYLDHNLIITIPSYIFLNLTNLHYLDMRNNKVIHIENNAFTAAQLETVYLTTNDLDSISSKAFEGASSVNYLSLSANRLKKIPNVGKLVGLKSLVLEGNSINDVTIPDVFRNLHHLDDIVLSNNPIGKLTDNTFLALELSNVKKLEISRSKISQVTKKTFEPLKTIQSLKIGYNPLDGQQLENVMFGLRESNIDSIDIRNLSLGGQIPSQTFALLRNTSIKYLKIPNNKILKIPTKAFANLPNLMTIDLSACHIQEISVTAFENLSVLNLLFLNDNSLSEVPRGLPPTLEKLYLNGNQIAAIRDEAFANLKNLQELYLGNNEIHQLEQKSFVGLENLKILHLVKNRLSTLPGQVFSPFTRLISLELNMNNINTIPPSPDLFKSMVSLTYLSLSDNGCSSVPLDLFNHLASLQYFHLENNRLGSLIASDSQGLLFQGCQKMEELYLSNNGISSIPDTAFIHLSSLKTLDLHENKVSHWASDLFASTQSLTTLDLSENSVSLLNQTSLQNFGSLKSLNLSENPFACTCDLRWFRNWMNRTKVALPKKEFYTCDSPSEWQGKPVMSFSSSKIDCMNYTLYYILGGAGCGLLVSSILLGILYRYRWFAKFRIYKAGRGIKRLFRGRREYEEIHGEDKVYDAYIACAEEDRHWVVIHLMPELDNGKLQDTCFGGKYKLCFSERDFILGKYVIANIIDSILASRMVFIVLTKHFVSCPRCEFELVQIQELKMIGDIEDYFVIKVGKLPHARIPKSIERILERGNYIQWPDIQNVVEFKERLADTLEDKTRQRQIEA